MCNCTCEPREPYSNYVIVRSHAAGVFAGVLCSPKGTEVSLKHARRLWFWSGAASLSQLSQEGVKKPNECKFPVEVPELYITQVLEILPTTERAQQSIRAVKEWSAHE